jgi:hypothetical protein
VLTRNIKDEKLQKWFLKMAGEIASLDAADPTVSGRKMQQLLSAMEDVEQFHQIESNQHVKHFLGDARELLRQMVRTVSLLLSLLAVQVQKVQKLTRMGDARELLRQVVRTVNVGFTEALLRLYSGAIKALFWRYEG